MSTPDAAAGIDCAELVHMTPPEAGEVAVAVGLEVNWRLQRTLPDGTTAADVVSNAPDWIVADILIADGQAFIFVAPADDPAAKRPKQPSC